MFSALYINFSETEAARHLHQVPSSSRRYFARQCAICRYLCSSWLIIVITTTTEITTITQINTTSFSGNSAVRSYDELAFDETQSLINELRVANGNNSLHVSDEFVANSKPTQYIIFNDSSETRSPLNNNSSAMILSALFSLQNNILNATIENENSSTYLLNLNYFNEYSSTANASLALPTFYEHLSNQNFTTYPSTSTQAIELCVVQNLTGTPQTVSRGEFIPVFEMVLGAVTYMVIIAMTIIGNILVVVAVFSYRPLKKVQNYFLVSLAASDLAVAVIVMPLHVVKFLADGRWLLGVTLCQVFTTFDILLCTSSIWNLCAIAIDRYLAIHNPIDYAQKRTPNFVCTVIAVVWLVSIMISVPPIIGWNDWSSQKLMDHCELTTEKAFVVYSASGSFFVPLCVMIVVYVKIFLSARQRIRTNRGRSALLKIGTQQNSSESVAPRFARLTPLVAATTTSVAHLLQRSSKSKHKNADGTVPPTKSKRSMSHASGAIFINDRLSAHQSQFANARPDRSNSSGGVLAVSTPTVLHLIAMAQRHNDSTNSSNNTLNGSAQSVNNYYNIMQQTAVDERQRFGEKKILTDEELPHLYKSDNKVDNKNNNLLFVITNDGPSTITQNGESMLSDTNTITTSSSWASTVIIRDENNQYRRSSSPIPPELQLPDSNGNTSLSMVTAGTTKVERGQTNGILKKGSGIPDEQTTANALKNRERISVAKEKRAAKTIAVIIFVFTFCWMPFFCVYVIMPFCTSCYIHPKVNQAVTWLGYINSSLNPFLYGILNLEFRRAFRKILCSRRFMESRKKQCAISIGRKTTGRKFHRTCQNSLNVKIGPFGKKSDR